MLRGRTRNGIKMDKKKYNEFADKYEIPTDKLDNFILLYNKPMLLKIISNLRNALNEMFSEMEEELEE